MRPGTRLLIAAAVLLAATGTVVAADNTAPMVDAGVDQTVTVNSTAYLDANGSVDPDGEITSVGWTIETPGGATLTPACADCRRTRFDATAVGQYAVTLTVTDDDGATRSDTLYVTAVAETGPDVSLAGPAVTTTDTDATVTANVSKDDASLQTLTWLVNDSVVERESLDGAMANVSLTHSFDDTGEADVRAVVYDTLGERGSATRRISVVGGDSGGTGSKSCYEAYCEGDSADRVVTQDGETYVLDTNGQDGIQINTGTGENALHDYGDNLLKSDSVTEMRNEDGIRVTDDTQLSDVTTENRETDDPINQDQSSNDEFTGDSGNDDSGGGGNEDSGGGNEDSGGGGSLVPGLDGDSSPSNAWDAAEDTGYVDSDDDSLTVGPVSVEKPDDDGGTDDSGSDGGSMGGGAVGAALDIVSSLF